MSSICVINSTNVKAASAKTQLNSSTNWFSQNITNFIVNHTSCVLTEPTLRIFSENTSGWLQLKKTTFYLLYRTK